MIARIWNGRVPAAKAKAYRKFVARRAVPDYRAVPGNLGVDILALPDGEDTHFMTPSSWESLDAIRGCAGDQVEAAKYYLEYEDFLPEFEPKAMHYTVVRTAP